MKIIHGPSIRYVTGRNLIINAAIRLTVQTGDLSVDVEFLVCETLSVPSILGCVFITSHVHAIRPGKRRAFFIDHAQPKRDTAIIKNLTLNRSRVTVVVAYGREDKSLRRLAKRVRLPPTSETVLPVNCDVTGLSRLRYNIRLYDRDGLTIANGIIHMPPSVPALVVNTDYLKM